FNRKRLCLNVSVGESDKTNVGNCVTQVREDTKHLAKRPSVKQDSVPYYNRRSENPIVSHVHQCSILSDRGAIAPVKALKPINTTITLTVRVLMVVAVRQAPAFSTHLRA